jgi:hypothetical protein
LFVGLIHLVGRKDLSTVARGRRGAISIIFAGGELAHFCAGVVPVAAANWDENDPEILSLEDWKEQGLDNKIKRQPGRKLKRDTDSLMVEDQLSAFEYAAPFRSSLSLLGKYRTSPGQGQNGPTTLNLTVRAVVRSTA